VTRVRLIHWKIEEARERAERLRQAGNDVELEPFHPAILRTMRSDLPEAVVIDLTRLPMQGRDVAVALRHHGATCRLPIVFVEGAFEKVAKIRRTVPDAVYSSWAEIRAALERAIAHPPRDPVRPGSVMAGYAGTPLPKKLGIEADSVVVLVGAPEGFERTLGEMPEGVAFRRRNSGRRDLTIWFARTRRELEDRIGRMALVAKQAPLWIVWAKKGSPRDAGLTQGIVRGVSMANGLVDFKMGRIDETWTGLKFTWRR